VREIILDTETTGLDPGSGHRVVEIGCIELVDQVPTGKDFQRYINPERDMPDEAFAVHGLSEEFLAQKPVFADVAEDFVDFIGDSRLVIHNATFDLKFLNAELLRLERAPIPLDRALDTVALARQKFPGAPASLDALCRRFQIDASARDKHGALLDADLLAQVYVELIGGRQRDLSLTVSAAAAEEAEIRASRVPRAHAPSAEEEAAHERFLDQISDPIWRR
jgi:DNA polymerase-3 subunit epsilon